MILKSYIVEKNIDTLREYQAVLMYGENSGIKDDIKNKLKENNKNSEIINLFESEIVKNKNILFENIFNESLFNEKKLFFLHSTTDKIFNEIEECLEKENKNVKIYIFAENLDKKSKLRNMFEKERRLAILACYKDNERTLMEYINKEFVGFKGLTGEMINIIVANSSSDRRIIQNEIMKIKGYFVEKTINKNDLLEILNIKNDTSFEEIRDNALNGKKDKINKLLSEIDLLNEDCFFYLNDLNYRVLKLAEIKENKKIFKSDEEALDNLKPPVFWKDKPVYLEQLKKWDIKRLNEASCRIGETELLIKKYSEVRGSVIIKDLIIALSKEASTFS